MSTAVATQFPAFRADCFAFGLELLGDEAVEQRRIGQPATIVRRDVICYQADMGDDLDDILAQTACPRCGREFSIRYRTLRLERTVDCPGCGVTIRPIDDTPIGAVQKLIYEARGDA